MADDPDDLLIHLDHPHFLFVGLRHFFIYEEAGQFLLFSHAQGIEIIALLPFAEEKRELNMACVEGGGLDTRCWMLDTRCWILDTRYWMLDADCVLLTVD